MAGYIAEPKNVNSAPRSRPWWPVKWYDRWDKKAKPKHCAKAQPNFQDALRSMPHITLIRIDASLSLLSRTACVAGTLGIGKAYYY